MAPREPYRDRIELLQGTLDLLILQVLQWGPRHGHGIGQMIRTRSEDALQIEHGSLYPALHRLQREGWIASEWKTSEANRRAKFYRLTPAGRRQLSREQSQWRRVVRAMARIMRSAEEA
jgi:PadR family transcriptional regulator